MNKSSLKTQRTTLYYFCSSKARENPVVSHLVLTFLHQFIRQSPKDKQKIIFRNFLRALDQVIRKGEKASDTESEPFKASSDTWLNRVLGTPADTLWTALMVILTNEPERKLLVVVDGLDNVKDETGEFIKGIRVFTDHLRQRIFNMKVLLTSQPQRDIKEVLKGLPCIEHDEARRSKACNPFHAEN